MSTPFDADRFAQFSDAIDRQDLPALRELMHRGEFILINVQNEDGSDEDDDEHVGALTADMDGNDVLVVFTSEEHAGEFVNEMGDVFSEGDEIEGFSVDGESLLSYLPESFGMLFNPESDDTLLIPSDMAEGIRDAAD